MKYLSISFFVAVMFIGLSSCTQNNFPEGTKDFGIFKVLDDEQTIEMNGTIGKNTLIQFNTMMDRFPNLNHIVLKEVPGSMNDEINLQVSLLVYQNDISTHLDDNGLIASGGVDFFLAGTTRTMGSNAMIGVHSWSGAFKEATDFEVGHENHLPYINYYKDIGFSQAEAEDFYYFTINAAAANDIHYMTETEIEEYKILKP